MKYLLIALLCFSSNLFAAEVVVTFGGWSHHLGDDTGVTTSSHSLLGIEFIDEETNASTFLAKFKNSYGRGSLMFGAGHHWNIIDDIRLGLHGGLVYGYTSCIGNDGVDARFCPIIVPSVSYTKLKIQPTVMVLGTAVVFAFNYQF